MDHIDKESADRDGQFVAAIEAVISGDTETLKRLLESDPELVRRRSSEAHGATLIQYISANVEDEYQRTPANAVEVARILLEAGAEVDVPFADGGASGTPLVSLVTSVHPHEADVAGDLVRLLVEAGARVDGIDGKGAPLRLALSSEHPDSVEALLDSGAQIVSLEIAASMGKVDRFRDLLGREQPAREELEEVLRAACKYGQTPIVELLLDEGVETDVPGWAKNTGLHYAAQHGRRDTVELLLSRGASIHLKNDFGGDSLGVAFYFLRTWTVPIIRSAHWSAPDPDYAGTIDLLLEAGATIDGEVKETKDAKVNEMLGGRGVGLEDGGST